MSFTVDPFDFAAQARCPDCGTVMVSVNGGEFCRGCTRFDPDTTAHAPRPTGADDLPGVKG